MPTSRSKGCMAACGYDLYHSGSVGSMQPASSGGLEVLRLSAPPTAPRYLPPLRSPRPRRCRRSLAASRSPSPAVTPSPAPGMPHLPRRPRTIHAAYAARTGICPRRARGTLGTHIGYSGYSHGVLWVLTWGSRPRTIHAAYAARTGICPQESQGYSRTGICPQES
jgi:hypothetical protein